MRGGWAQWGVGEEGGRKFGMLGVMRKVVPEDVSGRVVGL